MGNQYDRELEAIEAVADVSPLRKFLAYAKLSGPGWLQGAITLGGGSLAGALFLGVVSGYGLLWVQPLAMICGIIMLSAISYITLSTGKRPFQEINLHLHPLLGWSWLIATIMANIVWTMPQFSLATAAIQQNLLGGNNFPPGYITLPLLALGLFVNHLYQREGAGAKTFDLIIKIIVGIIVLSFFAVVGALLYSGQLDFGKIFSGLLPDFSLLSQPANIYEPYITASPFSNYWEEEIIHDQRDVIMAAFGSAVGINMTFLLPYSLLKKRWGKKHRGLSITDLSIGLFVPFFLATSCVVIAAATSFHGEPMLEGSEAMQKALATASAQIAEDLPNATESVTEADAQLAFMLKKRDADALATTLEPIAGETISQTIFGIGVLGMALSTIIILMLINGLAFQEVFGSRKPQGSDAKALGSRTMLYYIGCAVSGIAGCCYPFLWTGDSKAALAVPTSVIGGSMIPIAYFTFLLMMNSKKILGEHRPEGIARVIWNILMIFATSVATLGSVWVLVGKTEKEGWAGTFAMGGLGFLAVLFVVGIVSFLYKENKTNA